MDVNETLEKLGKGFEEFKATNEKRLAEEAKGNTARAKELDEKLAKISADLDKFESERKKATDEIEKKLGRLELGKGGTEDGEETKKAREYKKAIGDHLRRRADESKVLVRSNDTGAGYLMGVEMDSMIIKAAVEVSPVRDLVTVQPIGKGSIKEPKLTNAPAMAAKVAETGTRSESTNPAYGVVEIPTHEFYAMHAVSHQALEDSDYPLEGELAEFIGWQFGLREANDIVKGTGVGEAFGFTDASQGVGYTASGVDAKIADADGTADGLIDLIHAVKESYARNGRFVLNRKTLAAVRKLKDTTKQYIWQPGLQAGIPATILNYPYTEVSEMADIASNAYPIAFGDFKRAYKFHPRIASSILVDPYSLSTTGQVRYTAYRRHGGAVVLAEAIRLLKCAAS